MKGVMMMALLVVSSTAVADEFVQFSDGSTGWRGQNGQIWGKTPSPSANYGSGSGYGVDHGVRQPIVDTQRGTVYAPAGNGYINTETGDFVPGR